MASQVSNHTVRIVVGCVQQALFPSRRWALVALTAEVAALAMGLPLGAHALVAVSVHVMVALVGRLGRARSTGTQSWAMHDCGGRAT